MSYRKFSLTLLTILLKIAAFSQDRGDVSMKWIVKPGEPITYKAYIKLDTADSDKSPFDNFFNSIDSVGTKKAGLKSQKLSSTKKDYSEVNRANAKAGFVEMMQRMRSLSPDYYVTTMKAKQRNLISVEMLPYKAKTEGKSEKQDGFMQMFQSMESEPWLEADIHDDGTLESFYLSREESNIVALFFQLPAKPVKVNDTLSIPTHFVNIGSRFKCDSSYRRCKVWIADITDGKTGKIVTVKYDIEEYVNGNYRMPFPNTDIKEAGDRLRSTLHTTFKAIATFSVAKGKWLTYEGTLETSNTGMLGFGHSKTWYRLVSN